MDTTLMRGLPEVARSLLIVDPVSEALANASTSDSASVRTFFRMLSRPPGQPGVLLVAHDTKAARNEARSGGAPGAGAIAGSAAWYDWARGAAYLYRTGENGLVECVKCNHGRGGWGLELEPRYLDGRYAALQEGRRDHSAADRKARKAARKDRQSAWPH